MTQLTVAQKPVIDVAGFRAALEAAVRGDVKFDALTRGVYATDASHYQLMPRCVVVPVDEADVVAAVGVAGAFRVPVTARGGGTSLSGQAAWTGLVIDVSKNINALICVDPEQRTARVQPGLVRDHLNAAVKAHGLHFAPDPATTSRATIGGMIGNNSSGTRSILYGKTSDHIVSMTVAMADGTVWVLGEGREDDPGTPEGAFTQTLQAWLTEHADDIERRFPKLMRRVSGYALDTLLAAQTRSKKGSDPFSLVPLWVGSEGTLGVVLEATVRLEPLPRHTALCIGHFDEVAASLRCIQDVVNHGPSAVELLDDVVCAEAVKNPSTRHLADFIQPLPGGTTVPPKGVLICEFFGSTPAAAAAKAQALAKQMTEAGVGYAWPLRTDPAGIQRVWDVRRLGLGLISNTPGPVKGQAFIEDACVPLKHLADYIDFVFALCEAHGVRLSIYAHASVGVIHCRPMLDLHRPEHVQTMEQIAEACFDKVLAYGGSFSSEHGDGLVRGQFIQRFYGPQITGLFARIKNTLDPKGVMNPGKKVAPGKMTEHLRYQQPGYPPTTPVRTRFHYRQHGGLLPGVEQCNGVGACRKTQSGTMCPSYMALRDETHATRGRANALRLALSGQLDGMAAPDAMASDALHEALDQCLSCKACQTECPNGVDLAKYKAEAQQLRHDRRGVPLRSRLIGSIDRLAALGAGPWAPLLNAAAKHPVLKRWAEKATGLSMAHGVPRLRRKAWPLRTQQAPANAPGQAPGQAPADTPLDASTDAPANAPDVVLYADTYARFFEGGQGEKALTLLEALGFRAAVVAAGCCQRPAISQGLLDQAKRRGTRTLDRLARCFDAGVPVLVIEPSCYSALTDDLPDLVDDPRLAAAGKGVQLLDRFLLQHVSAERWRKHVRVDPGPWVVHGHCHDQATAAGAAVAFAELLRRAGGAVEVADAGCCGMAGAFGHEQPATAAKVFARHLEKIDRAWDRWGKSAPERRVILSGFSCRMQYGAAAAQQRGVLGAGWLDAIELVADANR